MWKVTEVVQVSQLCCVGSGNKLQKQKKGPWSLGKARIMCLGGRRGGPEMWACSREGECQQKHQS